MIGTLQGVKHLGPDFEVLPDGPPSPVKFAYNVTGQKASLKSGGLEVRVDRAASGFAMEFVRTERENGEKEKVLST